MNGSHYLLVVWNCGSLLLSCKAKHKLLDQKKYEHFVSWSGVYEASLIWTLPSPSPSPTPLLPYPLLFSFSYRVSFHGKP